MNRFYSLEVADEERWHIDLEEYFMDGTPVDIWAYSRCKFISDPKAVPFQIEEQGKMVDYNPTAFLATVVSDRMGRLLREIAADDVQLIPAIVKGASSQWMVANVLKCIDCIDHSKSSIQYYPPNHPEKGGKPRGVVKLVLNPDLSGNAHIFHPKDWEVELVVSEHVKVNLERIGATGLEFILVT